MDRIDLQAQVLRSGSRKVHHLRRVRLQEPSPRTQAPMPAGRAVAKRDGSGFRDTEGRAGSIGTGGESKWRRSRPRSGDDMGRVRPDGPWHGVDRALAVVNFSGEPATSGKYLQATTVSRPSGDFSDLRPGSRLWFWSVICSRVYELISDWHGGTSR